MSKSMIAAIIVMIFACGFVGFMVYSLASSIKKKMKKEIYSYIKVYNQYLENDRIKQKEMDLVEKASLDSNMRMDQDKRNGLPAIPFIPKSQPMQNATIIGDYKKIRNAFQYDLSDVIAKMDDKDREANRRDYQTVTNLLHMLSYENVYKISCLQPEEQKALLTDIMDSEELRVLDEFESGLRKTFHCEEFVSYLGNKQKELDQTIRVYAPKEYQMVYSKNGKDKLCVLEDERICEGFQVMRGNLLYDYAICNSDLVQ